MNIERLKKIINFSITNHNDIESKVRHFYSYTGMNDNNAVLNIMQIVRPAFRKKGFIVIEMPFEDEEIGALCYKGTALGYTLINTSLPKVNTNFAICHEIYHVFYQENEFRPKMEFIKDYYEHEEEYAANLFAGMLLMPETNFRTMYEIFKKESLGNERDTIIRLMNYYQVPYMAALVRCYELNLSGTDFISEELLSVNNLDLEERFSALWLDDGILKATNRDDFNNLISLVESKGNEYVYCAYLNKASLKKVIQNMKALYNGLKGE